ncbi:LacI family DNA-binding transcriptional regulator [Candidatus Arthromitus sp. SFB-rat-Yit]|uniref:LacI family DNA-binding transcriptional regulator n=1 Tax=Candidatus Arthromitus sp. SFB-rat-Yit TaxID=1041504 RepID=UPI000227A701|nr:LacI family DNA-binding transcriptional regulator [Candidatus Arthromitus sp. SFB-rat-Yit]BAK81720.1 transcriptional regulator, LacI family [Candidatus Arthromitus sp. SFB-rat-Yit]
MVTIKDISDSLGISISSVSKALNGGTDISQKTREKVIEVANELGYIKKNISNKLNLKLGIIVDQNCDEYKKILNYDIIQGFNSECIKDGNSTSIIYLKSEVKKICIDSIIRSNNLSGALLLLNNISDSMRRSILKLSYPIVIVNSYVNIDKQNIGYVGIDMIDAMSKVVKCFVDMGHEKISFVSIKGNDYVYQDKLVGYIAALTSFGINYNPDNVLNVSSEDFDLQILKFVDSVHTNAICADNDFTAYRILNILINKGYRVPEDISIIGFDNNFIFNYLNPSLSTVNYDKFELGVKAYFSLKNIINGNNISKMQIKCDVLKRESTKI